MKNKEKIINCIDDALEIALFSNFEKGDLIFRGQVNFEWKLIPKLFRLYPKEAHRIELVMFESLLNRQLLKYQKTYDPIEFLVNLQHFNIPTRLLDFTTDILIALFFACHDENGENKDKDGAIYYFFKDDLTKFKFANKMFEKLIHPISSETITLFKERLEIRDIQYFEPLHKNPRMRIQEGCFLFFPFLPLNQNDDSYVDLLSFIGAKNEYWEKINPNHVNNKFWLAYTKVSKESKSKILKELDEDYGISKNSLYVNLSKVNDNEESYKNLYERAKLKLEWLNNQRINNK